MTLYKYTEKELKELLESIVILTDSREQKNDHITEYFTSKGVKYMVQKLDYGDYSCMIPKNEALGITRDMYFSNIINLERKASLVELSGNCTKGRTRLESEFLRAKGKLILLIENSTYGDLIRGKYNTKYDSKSFLASLKAFESRYNFSTTFLQDKSLSGNFIYFTLYYHVREFLLNGPTK